MFSKLFFLQSSALALALTINSATLMAMEPRDPDGRGFKRGRTDYENLNRASHSNAEEIETPIERFRKLFLSGKHSSQYSMVCMNALQVLGETTGFVLTSSQLSFRLGMQIGVPNQQEAPTEPTLNDHYFKIAIEELEKHKFCCSASDKSDIKWLITEDGRKVLSYQPKLSIGLPVGYSMFLDQGWFAAIWNHIQQRLEQAFASGNASEAINAQFDIGLMLLNGLAPKGTADDAYNRMKNSYNQQTVPQLRDLARDGCQEIETMDVEERKKVYENPPTDPWMTFNPSMKDQWPDYSHVDEIGFSTRRTPRTTTRAEALKIRAETLEMRAETLETRSLVPQLPRTRAMAQRRETHTASQLPRTRAMPNLGFQAPPGYALQLPGASIAPWNSETSTAPRQPATTRTPLNLGIRAPLNLGIRAPDLPVTRGLNLGIRAPNPLGAYRAPWKSETTTQQLGTGTEPQRSRTSQ